MASQSDSEASTSAAPAPLFSEQELLDINAKLAGQSPQDILTWAIDTLPEGALWQTTAFGLCVASASS